MKAHQKSAVRGVKQQDLLMTKTASGDSWVEASPRSCLVRLALRAFRKAPAGRKKSFKKRAHEAVPTAVSNNHGPLVRATTSKAPISRRTPSKRIPNCLKKAHSLSMIVKALSPPCINPKPFNKEASNSLFKEPPIY